MTIMMKGLKERSQTSLNEDSSDQSGENSGEQSGDESGQESENKFVVERE